MRWLVWVLVSLSSIPGWGQVTVGLDRLFSEGQYLKLLQGKRVTLIAHSAAIDRQGRDVLTVFQDHQHVCSLSVLCTLEHGYYGGAPAESPGSDPAIPGVQVISLYGVKEVPEAALRQSDVLVYDVQDIGVRSYVFVDTLLQIVRAAERYQKPLVVLDRPNPLGGHLIDGPLPKEYAPAIPYCYGMTPGELALFYRSYYAPKSSVTVVPMQGWKRSMTFADTGLSWVPTSPQIPDPQTAFFYATTGVIGALSITSIGVGYTLPFKVLGAPWMDGKYFASELNKARLPGIRFIPFSYEPFFGKYKMELCSGVLLMIEDPKIFLPMETQCTILGVLKNLYPSHVDQAFRTLENIPARKELLKRSLGGGEIFSICLNKRYIVWPLRSLCVEGRARFREIRKPFLLSEYEEESEPLFDRK